MSADECLRIAGDAAVLLEEMGIGLTAVARLSDGVVTLECWTVVNRRPLMVRHIVADPPESARMLAERCASQINAALTQQGPLN